jgi:hypothetical protein
MGASFGTRCYLTASEAVDAYFLSMPPQVFSGSTSYSTSFQKFGSSWYSVGFSVNSAGVWTQRYSSIAPVPSFPTCDPSASFHDGMLIGWGISSVLVLAASIKFLQRVR